MMLDGKVALVTGGGRGLGRAHALALAGAGASVMVNDLGGDPDGSGSHSAPAEDVVGEIVASGGNACADSRDASQWASAADLIAHTLDAFGRIDIIVANAGICRPTAFGALSEYDWDRQMDVNAKGMAALIEAATRHWTGVGLLPGRAVICTSSPAGGHPNPPLGIYGVTKAAVLALAQIAAQELGPLGVRVNALGPVARTRMLGAALAGMPVDVDQVMPRDAEYDLYDPDHIARLVLYLASPLCRFTGRFFGVRADDIYLFDCWEAAGHVGNEGKAWTIESLARALEKFPATEEIRTIGPKGLTIVEAPSPKLRDALECGR